jgi:hypothetical protein
MSKECSMHGKYKKYIQIFIWENLRENHFRDVFTKEKIRIKWLLRKRKMNMLTEPGAN